MTLPTPGSYGSCASCGTPRAEPDQAFCAICGAAQSPSGLLPIEPIWTSAADQPAPKSARSKLSMILWGALALTLAVGVTAVIVDGYKLSPANVTVPTKPAATRTAASRPSIVPPKSYPGALVISFSPQRLSCDSPVDFTTKVTIPSSVKTGNTVSVTFDGQVIGSVIMNPGNTTTLEADGSWLDVSTTTADQMKKICSDGGSAGNVDVLTPGTHTMTLTNAAGSVLAAGSYEVVAPAPTPSPPAPSSS